MRVSIFVLLIVSRGAEDTFCRVLRPKCCHLIGKSRRPRVSRSRSGDSCVPRVFGRSIKSAHVKHSANKKTDVAEHPWAFHHVGLLVNEPPSTAGLLFI
jgi:hypothetical protein